MGEPFDRREPLPELHAIPAWLWRKAPRAARVALVAGVLLAVAGVVALAPGIRGAKREEDRRQAAERRSAQAAQIRALRAEQRPRRGRVPGADPSDAPAEARLAARRRMLDAVERRILQDARRRRLSGDPLRASCRPFPRGVDDREDLRRTRARYACLAVTAEIPPSESNTAGLVGHPYRLLIEYGDGRYAFCKISGVPGEGSFRARRPVTVPAACGG